jgi:Phage integrase family
MNMHRARHTFATDLRRVADLGAASQALGHSDLSTTAAIYGHYDLSDLERARTRSPRLGGRRQKSRPTEVFQSTGSKNGSVEPTMEAAGIEPASEVAQKSKETRHPDASRA